jgi:adenylate kinase
LLRAAAEGSNPAAAGLRALMNSGALVGEKEINEVVTARLGETDVRSGFVLDGYPRTRSQASHLESLINRLGLPAPVAIELVMSEPALKARLLSRQECIICGRVYNTLSRPPAHEDFCDDDGGFLIRRSDDNQATISKRFAVYYETIGDLVAHSRARWEYHRIDANRSPADLLNAVEEKLGAPATV